ncbi:MAG: DUF502 domain-containing protein [Planctomycetaceae bacterium]
MKRLLRFFLQGLVFVVPLALTAFILVTGLRAVDGWLGLPFPGLGVAVIAAAVTVVGMLGSSFLTRGLLQVVERILGRLPLVRMLHGSVKDLMSAFVGEKRRFDKPVLVDLGSGGGVRALGFVTRESLDPFGLPGAVAVYLPQSYNFAGQLVVVPRAAVTPIPRESSQVMAFIISGGVTAVAAGAEEGKA